MLVHNWMSTVLFLREYTFLFLNTLGRRWADLRAFATKLRTLRVFLPIFIFTAMITFRFPQ